MRDATFASPGLPGDQHAALVRRQKLEKFYQRRGSDLSARSDLSSNSSRRSSVESSRLSPEQRLAKSEMRSATRQALGHSWHPSDGFSDSSSSAGSYQSTYGSHWEYKDDGKPIPQEYIDQFNRRWHEDDEDNDADQFVADMQRDATWRKHQALRPMYIPGGEFEAADHRVWSTQGSQTLNKPPASRSKSNAARIDSAHLSLLRSKFSWSDT